jgi:hypothetical protein
MIMPVGETTADGHMGNQQFESVKPPVIRARTGACEMGLLGLVERPAGLAACRLRLPPAHPSS